MSSRFGLKPAEVEQLREVFYQYPAVERVIVYGSRAKGTHRRGSDIDITIVGEVDWYTLNQLSERLDDLLLPYQIDLSVLNHIDNPELKAHIERVGQPL